MGSWHAHAVARSGGSITGIVDHEPERASRLARRYRAARVFSRIDDALHELQPDVVHVCTPLDSHVELARSALAAGCNTLVEKPLTATAPETESLLSLAAAAGRHLAAVHQFGFQDGVLEIGRQLETLGEVVHLELGTASAGASGKRGAQEGADLIAAEILPHFLSLTRRLLGGSLSNREWSLTRPRPGEWRVSGAIGAVSVGYFISMAARPTFAELRLLGERGSVRADLFHGYAVWERGTVSRWHKITRPFRIAGGTLAGATVNLIRRTARRETAYPGLARLIREFYRAAAGSGPNPVSPEETLDVAIARDRLMSAVIPNGDRLS